jgi:serine/threonine-protein kinase RsbW
MITLPLSVLSKLQSSSLTPRTRTFPGTYASLAEIGAFVREAAQDAGLSDFSIYMVETAVDEACSNIIEHAYGGEGNGNIVITCQERLDNLTVQIQDWGHTFDPDSVPDPDISLSLEDQPGHGLGLYFMRKWMDEVEFTSSAENGNVLTMIKYKEQKP